jgi:hypothetical protein
MPKAIMMTMRTTVMVRKRALAAATLENLWTPPPFLQSWW